MSVTAYQCDKCKRQLELVDSQQTITIVNKCIITKNCKGKLQLVERKYDGIIGKPSQYEQNIEDYVIAPRLYVHTQVLPASVWKIKHKLSTNPIVVVYVNSNIDGKQSYREVPTEDIVVDVVDENNITVYFANNQIGIVHVISRSSIDVDPVAEKHITLNQITSNGILTIGVPIHLATSIQYQTQITIYDPSTNQPLVFTTIFTAHKFNDQISLFDTPWKDAQVVATNGVIYKCYSVRVSNIFGAVTIQNGSYFKIDNSDVIILTSNQPHQLSADIKSHIVIPSSLNNLPINATRFDNFELLVDEDSFILYYPGVKILQTIRE